MNSFEGALILIVAIIPGFVASLFVRGRDISPTKRSPTESIAFLLHFAVYVNFVAILVFSMLDLWLSFQLLEIVENGPRKYFLAEPLRGSLVFGGYLFFIIVILSPLVGVFNLPRNLPRMFLRPLDAIGLIPGTSIIEEPIWYSAFHRESNDDMPLVWVRVRMKNSDIYSGTLRKYPLVEETVPDKDFLIDNVFYYPGGNEDDVEILNNDTVEGFGGVMLNTRNVDSIDFRYYRSTDDSQSGA